MIGNEGGKVGGRVDVARQAGVAQNHGLVACLSRLGPAGISIASRDAQVLAILHHRADIVSMLCSRGQNPNTWPPGGYVPEALAEAAPGERAKGGFLPTNVPVVQAASSPLELALWLSAARRTAGKEEPLAVANALVNAGADVNHTEVVTGVPMLHRRVVQNDAAGARFLLDSSACKVDQILPTPAALPEPVPPGQTPVPVPADSTRVPGSTTTVIHEAAYRDMVDVIRAVLARPEAPVNVCVTPTGDTALHTAIRLQHEASVVALLRRPPTLTIRYG